MKLRLLQCQDPDMLYLSRLLMEAAQSMLNLETLIEVEEVHQIKNKENQLESLVHLEQAGILYLEASVSLVLGKYEMSLFLQVINLAVEQIIHS